MGWNAQPTARGDLRECPRARRQPARRRGRRLQDRHGRARRRAASTSRACSLGGAQSGARQGARLHERAQGVRQARSTNSRRCSSSSPTWRPNWRPRARCLWRAAAALDAQGRPTRPSCARWPSASRTDAGFEVANQALQLHGGYGYLARIRHREDRARPARAPDPRRHQRDHAPDRGAQADRGRAMRRYGDRAGS